MSVNVKTCKPCIQTKQKKIYILKFYIIASLETQHDKQFYIAD